MNPIAALANVMVALAGILFVVMPEMSRPGLLFGVTVSADFRKTADGRKLVASYRLTVTMLTLALLALASLVPVRELLIPLRIGLEGIVGIASWIRASRKTRAFAVPVSSIRVASLARSRLTAPGGWLFVLGPYIIPALAIGYLYANWDSVPETFAVHWGRDGAPNRWAHRTVAEVFALPLIGMLTNTITILLAFAVFFRTRNIGIGGGNATDDIAFKRATFFVMVFVCYTVSTLLAVMGTRSVWSPDPNGSPSQFAPLAVTLVVALAAGLVVYLARVSRSRKGSGDGTPDACWKWGMFYYNPDDASFFVEKRMGLGWTLNFANKWVWISLAVIPLTPVVIAAIVRLAD
jgi:uncharacterized membrane protein